MYSYRVRLPQLLFLLDVSQWRTSLVLHVLFLHDFFLKSLLCSAIATKETEKIKKGILSLVAFIRSSFSHVCNVLQCAVSFSEIGDRI